MHWLRSTWGPLLLPNLFIHPSIIYLFMSNVKRNRKPKHLFTNVSYTKLDGWPWLRRRQLFRYFLYFWPTTDTHQHKSQHSISSCNTHKSVWIHIYIYLFRLTLTINRSFQCHLLESLLFHLRYPFYFSCDAAAIVGSSSRLSQLLYRWPSHIDVPAYHPPPHQVDNC